MKSDLTEFDICYKVYQVIKANNFGTCCGQYKDTALCLKENIEIVAYPGNNLVNNERQLTSEA